MSESPSVGDTAPDFSLPDQDGKLISSKGIKGKRVVLYFYPKDDTPGCTKEACEFRDAITRITKTGVVLLGVSLDPPECHRKFIDKYGLPFSLLSDEHATVSKAYGVYKEKNMYGRKYWGIERSTFIIDPTGKLTGVFRKVKVDGHVDAVLNALNVQSAHSKG